MEFLAPFSDDEEIDFPDQIAQLELDPMIAIFEKPSDDERQHLKALFVKGRVGGQPISKILIDGGGCNQHYAICSISETWQRRSRFDQDRYDVERY